MDKDYASKREFFASANGYSGFKSYFGTVFDSHKFDRIFVLKGGPGSGKSTLMKKIANDFKDENLSIELFRCSSDKNSLDGIIIDNTERRTAILDGTAPHERDAVIPGAVDVIVNLGDSFETDALYDAKKEIFELNREKKNSYQKAYDNLSKSSIFDNNIKAELSNNIDFGSMSYSAKEIIKLLKLTSDKDFDVRLLSSFSKDGYTSLEGFNMVDTEIYSVSGEYGSEKIFMSIFEKELKNLNMSFMRIPSPLDEKAIEGIYFKERNLAIIGNCKATPIYNSLSALKIKDKASFIEKINTLGLCKSIYETEASEAFNEASKYHFDLEKIYTAAVNFEIINKYTERISDSLSKIFK